MAEPAWNSEGKFRYEANANHGKTWSFADIDELRLHCETGGTLECAATLLYRTLEEVQQKAMELGLVQWPPPSRAN